MANVQERVIRIISEVLSENGNLHSNVQYAEKLDDIGMNSLLFIKAIVLIEDEFGFEFNDDDLDVVSFETIGDFCNHVVKITSVAE